ncbi:hypothetical protein VTN00DRAFT_3171 [Thermoascus crustaceus]|uniref:uncharacterized protein n=1 Tax=Thermoascus crustaceus TaxID=5088 RepID=UPI00374328DF
MPSQTHSVELTNRNDPTLEPFLEACRQGDLPRVQAQVEHLDRKDGSLTHGLRTAAKVDHVETMRRLLEHGAIMDQSVVFGTRSPSGFQVLINHGFRVNDPMGWGYCPLMQVVEKNDEIASDNPIKGDNLPVPNSGGPHEVAAQCCSTKIVDILLDHGARIENSLVLHRAALRRTSESIPMMEHLVRRGADVNKRGAFAVVLQHG